LGAEQKKVVARILRCLQSYYASERNLSIAREIDSGFFYKQLQKPYYETGVESNIRIVLRREQDKCIAVLAGNHGQIKQFLAKV